MVESSEVFEENYQQYCAQIEKIDLESISNELGIEHDGTKMFIPFLKKRYLVSNSGFEDESGNRPDYMICVILAKYILMCPDKPHYDDQWVSFKDFKRASHFTNVNYFSSDTEKAIEKHFSGKLNELKKACKALDGSCLNMELSYDLSMKFDLLPRISLLLLFNDGDQEFPARCKVLFQKHAEYYLDPESLAMTSASLAKRLSHL